MQPEPKKLKLKKAEQEKIPAGIGTIFYKEIVPADLEQKTVLYNKKYRHLTFAPAGIIKPVSKILTLK